MGSPSIFASAIGQAEGYGVPGAIPTLANNPGDLKLGDVGQGTMGSGITVFGSAEEGWQALENQLSKITGGSSAYYNPQMTIGQMGQVWSGGDPNWANNVSNALGTSPSTTIGNFLNGSQNEAGQQPIPSLPGWDYSALPGQSSQGEAQGAGGAPGTGTAGGDSGTSTWARIAAGLVGLICIGGGVMMFRQSQVIIQGVAGVAKKAAAAAAAVLLALALGSSSARGQYTTAVTATLTDSDGQAWANCTWAADLFNPSGGQQPIYTNTGQPVPVHITGQTCNASGSLSFAIPDNNQITPVGTRWVFTLASNTSAPPTVTNNVLVTGASMNLTANLSGQLVAPRFNPGSEKRGYLDVEVLNPVQGSLYYNVVSLSSRQYNGTAWTTLAGGGGGGLPSTAAIGQTVAYNGSTWVSTFASPFYASIGATIAGDSWLAQGNTIAQNFGTMLCSRISGVCNDLAVAGSKSTDEAVNMIWPNVQNSYTSNMSTIIEAGVNDANSGGMPFLQNYQYTMQGMIAQTAIPNRNKVWGNSWTVTGGPASHFTAIPGVQGAQSSTNGVVFSATTGGGTKVDIAWWAQDGNGGTAALSIDGGAVTDTLNAYGFSTIGVTGVTQTIFDKQYTVPSAGSHSVTITITSATNANNIFAIIFAATPYVSTQATSPPKTYIYGVPYQNADAISSTTAAFDSAASSVTSIYANEGLPVIFIPTRNFINSTSDMTSSVGLLQGGMPLTNDFVTTTDANAAIVTSANSNFGPNVVPSDCTVWNVATCWPITIIGAGASGGNLVTYIVGYISQTQIQIATPALTAASGLAAYYGPQGSITCGGNVAPLHANCAGYKHMVDAYNSVAQPVATPGTGPVFNNTVTLVNLRSSLTPSINIPYMPINNNSQGGYSVIQMTCQGQPIPAWGLQGTAIGMNLCTGSANVFDIRYVGGSVFRLFRDGSMFTNGSLNFTNPAGSTPMINITGQALGVSTVLKAVDSASGTQNCSSNGVIICASVAATSNIYLYDFYDNTTHEAFLDRQGNGFFNGVVTPLKISAGGAQTLNTAGCGAPTNLKGGASAGSFTTSVTSCTFSINIPTVANNGYFCEAHDITTTTGTFVQSGTLSTATCTLTGTGLSVNDTIVWFLYAF